MDQDLQNIMMRVARLGEVSEAEAGKIINDVYSDGIITRGEAEALFRVNDALREADPLWTERFREALKDYLLTREPPEGWVTDEESDWLMAQIDQSGDRPGRDEIDLLIAVLRYADGAPVALSRYTLKAISDLIKDEGSATADMVERIRMVLFAPGGEAGLWVNQYEAGLLFETNDMIAHAVNAPDWNDLFARAIGNHLMARVHPNPQTETQALAREAWLKDATPNVGGLFRRMSESFLSRDWFSQVTYDEDKAMRARMRADEAARRKAEAVTGEEQDWLLERLGWDKTISPAERALIEFLKKEAPGFTDGLVAAA